jgi:hypothetical protein
MRMRDADDVNCDLVPLPVRCWPLRERKEIRFSNEKWDSERIQQTSLPNSSTCMGCEKGISESKPSGESP